MTEEKSKRKIFTVGNVLWSLFLVVLSPILVITYTEYNKDEKVLLVANEEPVSLINGDLPRQIRANYALEDKPNIKVKSFFIKRIAIKNNGSIGVEKVPISICSKNQDIMLIDKPTIKTEPKNLIDIIKIQKSKDSTNQKHIWNISLLNPGDTITFEYFVYSDKKIKDFEVNAVAQKKDWVVKNGIILDQGDKSNKHFWEKMALGVLGITITFVVYIIMVIKEEKKKLLRQQLEEKGTNSENDIINQYIKGQSELNAQIELVKEELEKNFKKQNNND